MQKIGLLFPGQGSQFSGMAKELYDKERTIQEFFDQASSCTGINFVKLCFASSDTELRQTAHAQTSIFLVSASLYDLISKKYNIIPHIVAGHSSGYYAALYAAGSLSFVDGLYLLGKRAQFMDEATQLHPGTMIAVVGITYNRLLEVCQLYDDPENSTSVAQIVNINSNDQFVVSVTIQAIEDVAQAAQRLGGKVIKLNVAGPFHSRLMEQAGTLFAQYLVKVDINDPKIPVVDNVTANILSLKEEIVESLKKHLAHPVLWADSMKHLESCNVILEIGPGDKLSKMLKRQWPDKQIFAINTQEDIDNALMVIGNQKNDDPEQPPSSETC